MARVFRGWDARLKVWRAIKVLDPAYAHKRSLRQRFENEAATMAQMEHRNVVRVYDIGFDGPFGYMVMELAEGGCPVDWLGRYGPMPPKMAVNVVLQTCEGLSAAHEAGIIHRDIKPHNILVTRQGVCRVADFGIARADQLDAHMTKTGMVMGTLGFMAPEQRTDAKAVDERADIYAVGATLYNLLTEGRGRPVCRRAQAQDARGHSRSPTPHPGQGGRLPTR